MKRIIGFLVAMLGLALPVAALPTVMAQSDPTRNSLPMNGPCSTLSQSVPRTPNCDEEIMRNPFPELERPVQYDEQRDGVAYDPYADRSEAVQPRSILLPEEALPYPIAWQTRTFPYFDVPGISPADIYNTARNVRKGQLYYVYGSVQVANEWWYMIGPGQWMKGEHVSILQIPDRPDDVSGPWGVIDKRFQTFVLLEDDRPIFATLISAGYWLETVEGLYQIYGRTVSMQMSGPPGANPPEYQFNTRWVLFFNGDEALHSADFHNWFGKARSHGCVNMVPGDIEWVWNYLDQTANEWHPSGTTSFLVDNPDLAPYIYVHSSPDELTIPQW